MAVKYGTTGPNNIPGTPANDTIYGWAPGGNASSVSGNDTLTGIGGNDQLFGGTGNDSLTGGSGIDTLNGGVGNDIYGIDSTTDTITEATSGGTDTVQSSVSYTLVSNLENLTLIGAGKINGTGNSLNNTITGNAANNTLNGGTGNDTLVGGASDNTGNDTLYGGDGNDQLYSKNVTVSSPFTGGDVLYGGNGNDSLNGGYGRNNTLNGGSGNDTYTVFTNPADTIVEAANGGTDTVKSLATTYTLGDNLENLTLIGTAASNGIGNSLNNTITGNTANNTLNGAGGKDTLIGGAGSDIYIVDTTTDTLMESSGAGTDTVSSSVSYTLGPNLENLTLTGTGAVIGTGNISDNLISGNNNNNVLIGMNGDDILGGDSGADLMFGGDGNDFLNSSGTDSGIGIVDSSDDTLLGGNGNDGYYVSNTTDIIIENPNAGTDTVYSSLSRTLGDNLENLYIFDNATEGNGNNLDNEIYSTNYANPFGSTILRGYDGNDILYDRFGNDTLIGGSGNDTLSGGAGADTFVFNFLSDGVDTINDFGFSEGDKIQVSAIGFGIELYEYGRFLFNLNTGALSFDEMQFASLQLSSPVNTSPNLVIV